jgi:hypothetical protein
MSIEPGSEEEQLLLGNWIKRGQGLIVGASALGDSYLDPNVKRPDDVEQKSQEYVKFDQEVAEKLPHLKGKFRWDLEKYYRDRFGPYLPKD